MSSNHYYSKIGAAVLKLQFLSFIRSQEAHLRNAHFHNVLHLPMASLSPPLSVWPFCSGLSQVF